MNPNGIISSNEWLGTYPDIYTTWPSQVKPKWDSSRTVYAFCCTLVSTPFSSTKDNFYRQKHGCAKGSLVSPIEANLYMKEL